MQNNRKFQLEGNRSELNPVKIGAARALDFAGAIDQVNAGCVGVGAADAEPPAITVRTVRVARRTGRTRTKTFAAGPAERAVVVDATDRLDDSGVTNKVHQVGFGCAHAPTSPDDARFAVLVTTGTLHQAGELRIAGVLVGPDAGAGAHPRHTIHPNGSNVESRSVRRNARTRNTPGHTTRFR